MQPEVSNPDVIALLKKHQGVIDFAAELQVHRDGHALATCWHEGAEHRFTLRLSIDDFGNRTISGGVRVRGKYICTEHEFDAVAALVDDPSELPIITPVSSEWFRLTDSAAEVL